MATSTGWYQDQVEERRSSSGRHSNPRLSRELYRIRPLPNEAVCLWRKSIDNSGVVRAADRKTPMACVRSIFLALTLAIGFLIVIAPKVYVSLANMEIHRLNWERDALLRSSRLLEADEARLLSPERMQHLANTQGYVDPPSQSVHELSRKDGESLAMNSGSKQ